MSTQAVGAHFNIELMQKAQQRALAVMQQVASTFQPGLRESEATLMVRHALDQAGASAHWHPAIVRFGKNTTKIYSEASEPDLVLQPNDVFFIDIGPVFEQHEADVGATYAVGQDPLHQQLMTAVEEVFEVVADAWRTTGASGPTLYQIAESTAAALGYQLNHQIKGHRVGDFPHKLYASGQLGAELDDLRPGIWVLEIQLRHPQLAIGAFKEQVLF